MSTLGISHRSACFGFNRMRILGCDREVRMYHTVQPISDESPREDGADDQGTQKFRVQRDRRIHVNPCGFAPLISHWTARSVHMKAEDGFVGHSVDIFCGRKSRRIVFPNGAERPTAVLNKFHFQLEHSLARPALKPLTTLTSTTSTIAPMSSQRRSPISSRVAFNPID